MSKSHFIVPSGPSSDAVVVRLGAGTGAGNNMSTLDEGKLVKLVGESRYDLCAAGDPIEAVIFSVEVATSGGYSVGGVIAKDKIWATADGLQATPGTGAIAVGDYVVAGTATAKGTALLQYPKVCKATAQTIALHMWRVVSLGPVGTGAVGTAIVLQPISCAI